VKIDAAPDRRTWLGRFVRNLRYNLPLVVLDVAVMFGAYLAALVLRFEGSVPDHYWHNFAPFIAVAVVVTLGANTTFGLYGEMWRYASIPEARRIVLAGISAGGLLLALDRFATQGALDRFATHGDRPIPLSIIIIGATLSLFGAGAIRFQSRLFAFRRRLASGERRNVLVVGAGDAGSMIVRDLLGNPSLGMRPVAFADDDPRKRGRALHGLPIIGGSDDIPELVSRVQAEQVLLAIPSATRDLIQRVASSCEEAEVTLTVLPSVREIVDGRVTVRDIRDLQIEDLLGRQQVEMDADVVGRMLGDRRILITGAGGSIGSEIVRQVLAFEPAHLLLLDHDETHLFDLMSELPVNVAADCALADVRDRDRVLAVFRAERPDVVFHAAAHKHVPLLESHPAEAFRTNVLGTANVVEAAVAFGAGRFVLISTDKAVRPASVMGSSKWFAEQIVRSLQGNDASLCAVRFGNVIGSRGSVTPTFIRQIAAGGPVTVTDPSMARYFMSLQEAVCLVLQAAAMARGGEVFTLEMGDPVNIMSLARRLIRLSGRVPGTDVEIQVVGPRPGEKMVEDLLDPEEHPGASGHVGIMLSRPSIPDRAGLQRALRELGSLCDEEPLLADRMMELARVGFLDDMVRL
jgi:FlaA1/EpsC-like NDP-sugar epimerase